MWKKILIGFAAFVVALVVVSQFLPADWKVSRSVVINAKPAQIAPLLVDLKDGWHGWSSFDFQDPEIKYTYDNPKPGVGNKRSWLSKKMGNGVQEVTRADEKGVEYSIHMPEHQISMHSEFFFEPAEGGTKVTWTEGGKVGRNPVMRIMMSFMDTMMGPEFEKSLAKLKEVVEAKKK